ncbi:uncharacterized protein BHQ10_001095 [Talaromyces amestolkiae]|uniref:Uncharacterized protein n=1 Tax=Talaromyces amestolkiae TaxID=1196081 RepID=A0A364KNF1_TALAM|nr:uncharacterized protein BHQ10_001095 [Talaromyces amestolkiae]RAO65083.1 hypothetical protein BHQ10_001095 [Talaromyces amestolkiae]
MSVHQALGFDRHESVFQHDQVKSHLVRCDWSGPTIDTLYAGIAGTFADGKSQIGIALRNETYLLDFLEQEFEGSDSEIVICDFILTELQNYSNIHAEKLLGAALSKSFHQHCPSLCRRLWLELDIVPILLHEEPGTERTVGTEAVTHPNGKEIDEQAESVSRKCIRFFGPNKLPFLHVDFLGAVEVDSGFHINIADLESFSRTVRPKTWSGVQHYVKDLTSRKVKIAFFSATPQGGGVALMRHALVRLAHLLGVDVKWYVPKPRPGVFRITKTNHNILQGVAGPHERLGVHQQRILTDWIEDNAHRYWTRKGGPLTRPSEGGADVIIIDDPQMPALIPIAKQADPIRPVIYRSHIQMRSDLISTPGSPQSEVWDYLWSYIKLADIFISHPVASFVPRSVPLAKLGYMPACTDWLDGLNKDMRDWDYAYYGRIFNHACRNAGMPPINYPDDQYIVQIARFDPSKGIINVLKSYKEFRRLLTQHSTNVRSPKLLICGHGSVDDPDGSLVYDDVLKWIRQNASALSDDITVMRLGPSDQVLDTLLSNSRIVLQLSEREGFEVKVSEAIHKGKPIIATRAGGIPLQVEDQVNGFLVDVGDVQSVANHLLRLWTDSDLYERISSCDSSYRVSDEVSTVGQALNWFYLCSLLSQNMSLEPKGRWIHDLARESLGQEYTKADGKLKRAVDETVLSV